MKSLVPAYGRDYKSVKEVYTALAKGEEFTLSGCLDGGGYVTQKELLQAGENKVLVRYNKLRTQNVFGLPAPGTPPEDVLRDPVSGAAMPLGAGYARQG